jgi:hypothetical protein
MMLIHWYVLCCSAGWIATTVTHLWPMTAMFVIFIPLKMIDDGNRKWNKYYLFLIPVILFATNNDIFCVITLLVSFCFCLKSIISKKWEYYYYLLFFISLASLVYILFCPGVEKRFSSEVKVWFPNFMELSLLQKSALGIMNLFNYIVIRNRFVFMLSSFLIFIVIFKKEKCILYRILSFIPFCVSLSLGFLRNKIIFLFPAIQNLFVDGRFGGWNKMEEQYCALQQIFTTALIIFTLFSYLLSVYVIFKNMSKVYLLCLVILLGFFSQFILSFSPTVFASEIRTAILLFTTLAIIGTEVYSYYATHLKTKLIEYLFIPSIFIVLVIYKYFTGIL